MSEIYSCDFENCVAEIFCEVGYSVQQNVSLKNRIHVHDEIDIVAEKNNVKYCVEVKSNISKYKVFDLVVNKAKAVKMIPLIVVSEDIKGEKRNHYSNKYPEVILIDISNLLYAVKDREELRNKLIASLDYSVDSVVPEEGFIEMNSIKHEAFTESIINEMKLCQAGREMFSTYEELCHKLLLNIFSDDLALWKEQYSSNKKLYKFDLLCRIKDENRKTFWNILENFFNSKYVVFEFKNYKEEITQKEIYTTENIYMQKH